MRSNRLEALGKTGRVWASVAALLALGLPGAVLRFSGADADPALTALVFGVGIVAGAVLLSWAAEVAQMDVSASLAIAALALIAVLPEYMIEATLAWDAGESYRGLTEFDGAVTKEMSLASANVTGSNRLLIGVGWSAVIVIFWLKRRANLDMRGLLNLELPMLVLATALTLVIAFAKSIPIWLAAALIGAFVFYLWRSSTKAPEEPDLMGAAAMIGGLRPLYRRLCVAGLFAWSAGVILIAAEPFVHGLKDTGAQLGISEFLLIQWLAPLASESPEIIVAALFSLRSNPSDGLTTLISSQVNQLTLLVGSIALVFSVSAGQPLGFPLDYFEPSGFSRLFSEFGLQSSEFLLTAATATFGITLIATRVIELWHGIALFGVFGAYMTALLLFPNVFGGVDDVENAQLRLWSATILFGLAGLLVALNWRRAVYALRGRD